MTIRLISVVTRPQTNGLVLYRIVAADGTIYATANMWLASICQRAVDTQTPVRVQSESGWYYRHLTHVVLAPDGVVTEEIAW